MTTGIIEEKFQFFPVDLTGKLPPISPGFAWKWAWTELDANKLPRSTAGWTAEMQIRAAPNGVLIKELSTATGEIVNGGATGKFSVTLSAVETALISAGAVVFDVSTNAGVTPLHEFTGSVEVKRMVLR